jgi:2-methylisocitrate lyase-like PEP mutase family enzyme
VAQEGGDGRRARLYFKAGVDCVYPLGLSAPSLVAELGSAVGGPLNVNPSVPLTALAEAGAARVSIGPGAFRLVMAEFGHGRRNCSLAVQRCVPRYSSPVSSYP